MMYAENGWIILVREADGRVVTITEKDADPVGEHRHTVIYKNIDEAWREARKQMLELPIICTVVSAP